MPAISIVLDFMPAGLPGGELFSDGGRFAEEKLLRASPIALRDPFTSRKYWPFFPARSAASLSPMRPYAPQSFHRPCLRARYRSHQGKDHNNSYAYRIGSHKRLCTSLVILSRGRAEAMFHRRANILCPTCWPAESWPAHPDPVPSILSPVSAH